MKICRKCKSTDIKTRKNYSHGRGSKATIFLTCKKCGSNDIAVREERFRRRSNKF